MIMNGKIVVYTRKKESGEIYSVQLINNHTEDEIRSKIAEYNAILENEKTYHYLVVDNDTFGIIEFLHENREYDLKYHIDRLKDISYEIGDMQDMIDSTVNFLKIKIEGKNQ
jgi:hypothetical protein